MTLGWWESGTERLEEAVEAYQRVPDGISSVLRRFLQKWQVNH